MPKRCSKPSAASGVRGSSAANVAGPKLLTSIAVLPFVFLSDVEDSRALSLGFADALITIFGNLEDVVGPADIGDPELRRRYRTCPRLP